MKELLRVLSVGCATAVAIAAAPDSAGAHSGPPFPIVSNRVAGSYELSVWADPDTTDDGSAAGQFWIDVKPARRDLALPVETLASVSIRPLDRSGAVRSGQGVPVNRGVSPQFVALVMDHEGRFAVEVTIEGPLGSAVVDATVDATYDMRPPPIMLAVYTLPFVVVGLLWLKLLTRRQRGHVRRNPKAGAKPI
jgi:hypothetical protein